ncbi:MAG: hypothetical protein AB1512_21735 [Thermodesulfobacteriota bacterium]
MPGDEKRAYASLDIISFAALILAAGLFFYVAFYRTAEQNRRQFAELTQKAEEELKTLTAAQTKRAEESKPSQEKQASRGAGGPEGPVTDLTMLLQKVNADTLQSSMELSQIEKMDAERYRLTAHAPFERLLHFLLRVEQSNLALEDMAIHPLPGARDQVKLLLRVLGGDMSQQNRRLLDALQKAGPASLRNPFKRDGRTEPPVSPDRVDLTWKFRLTSIGIDSKGRYANIDRKLVHKGDVFNGMVVTEVAKDRVDLSSDGQKAFVAFRVKTPPRP